MNHIFSRVLKRATFWVALIVAIGLLGGPLVGDAPAAKKKPLRFGVADPLTGPAAIFGKDQMQAVRWAVEDINAKGGVNGHPLEAIILDHQAKPRSASQWSTVSSTWRKCRYTSPRSATWSRRLRPSPTARRC